MQAVSKKTQLNMIWDWLPIAREYRLMGFKLKWEARTDETVSLIAYGNGMCECLIKVFKKKDIPLRFNWVEKL